LTIYDVILYIYLFSLTDFAVSICVFTQVRIANSYSFLQNSPSKNPGTQRDCTAALKTISTNLLKEDSRIHVCSRHLSSRNLKFRCHNAKTSAVNFRALSRGLLRKTLKLQQQSFLTFQQYVSPKTNRIR
jgi:hypothetical protein